MTNAKSRLVRIIALALAVLMIVPMALVGCGKTDVDQAAIDAAIKEALDAAQKAQDAADKAAQDAKDAQDKLAEAEKEADKLQAEIDAMKNTTAAPDVTTEAPTQDSKEVDAYIASVLLDMKSEYNKLVATYTAVSNMYAPLDQAAIYAAIDTAKIAIGRATTVDYANQLVQGLKAKLDAILTYSERVKEAYDAIDFTSNVDVIDVVYAYELLLDAQDEKQLVVPEGGSVVYSDVYGLDVEALEKMLDDDAAALNKYGEAKIDLATLINDEYYRYTARGADNGIYGEDDILYKDIIDAYRAVDENGRTIADMIRALFGAGLEAKDDLNVADIEYDTEIKADIKAIEDAYRSVYNSYSKKEYASLQNDFEIAFAGYEYITLKAGNYLKDMLAVASARADQLVEAYKEYNSNIKKPNSASGLKGIVDAYNADPTNYLFKASKGNVVGNIDTINTVYTDLVAWMTKYGFDPQENAANLNAIVGAEDYAKFMKIKTERDLYVEWSAKLAAISDSDIEAALELVADANVGLYDYNAQNAAVKALAAWFYGTKADGSDSVFNAAQYNDADKAPYGVVAELSDANIYAMLKNHIKFNTTENDQVAVKIDGLKVAMNKFSSKDENGVETGILKQIAIAKKNAADLNRADFDNDEAFFDAIEDVVAEIAAICTELKIGTVSLEENKYGYNEESVNYDLVPFGVLDTLYAAKEGIVGNILLEAAKILKAYVSYKGETEVGGVALEDGILYFDGKYFEAEKLDITVFSYDKIAELAAIYNAIDVFNYNEEVVIKDVDGEDYKKTTIEVVNYFNTMYSDFYTQMADFGTAMSGVYGNKSIYSVTNAMSNKWIEYNPVGSGDHVAEDYATNNMSELATIVAKFAKGGDYADVPAKNAPNFVYPTSKDKSEIGKEANDIKVYVTRPQYAYEKDDVKYSYLNAILAVNLENYLVHKDGKVIDFDIAGYKAAIDAKVAEYRDAWYLLYLASDDAKTDFENGIKGIIANSHFYKLWNIKGEFEMNGYKYTFELEYTNPVTKAENLGNNFKVNLYNEFGEEVGSVVDGNKKEYTISAKFEGVAVKVYATGDETTLLSAVDDSKSAKFEYTLADGASAIMESTAKIGKIAKDGASGTYAIYADNTISTLLAEYAKNVVCVKWTSVNAAVDALAKAENIGTSSVVYEGSAYATVNDDAKARIAEEYRRFMYTWKDSSYTNTTVDALEKAYNNFVAKVNAIVAENGVVAE